jgi:hypothetical protein
MATIKLGQVVAEIRGKLGGTVFARNRGGSYARTFTKPTNPNSGAQGQTRAIFGTLMSDWRDLTQAQRDSFQAAAPNYPTQNKVGDIIIYSPSQLFCRVNMVLLSAGLAKIDAIPEVPPAHTEGAASQGVADSNQWTITGGALTVANFAVDVPDGALLADDRIALYASPVQSPGVKSSRTPTYRRIATIEPGDLTFTGATGLADVTTAYQDTFGAGTLTVGGQVVFLKAFIFNVNSGYQIPFGVQRYEFIEAV